MIISPNFEKLLAETANMVSVCWQQPDADKTRNGGYFCLLDDSTGKVIFVWQIGEILDVEDAVYGTKANKYLKLAIEKALRLHNTDAMSSWESRNPAEDKWGGAIRTDADKSLGFILSFSGLLELHDEAVVLATAVGRRLMAYGKAAEVATLSNNQMFFAMKPAA